MPTYWILGIPHQNMYLSFFSNYSEAGLAAVGCVSGWLTQRFCFSLRSILILIVLNNSASVSSSFARAWPLWILMLVYALIYSFCVFSESALCPPSIGLLQVRKIEQADETYFTPGQSPAKIKDLTEIREQSSSTTLTSINRATVPLLKLWERLFPQVSSGVPYWGTIKEVDLALFGCSLFFLTALFNGQTVCFIYLTGFLHIVSGYQPSLADHITACAPLDPQKGSP